MTPRTKWSISVASSLLEQNDDKVILTLVLSTSLFASVFMARSGRFPMVDARAFFGLEPAGALRHLDAAGAVLRFGAGAITSA